MCEATYALANIFDRLVDISQNVRQYRTLGGYENFFAEFTIEMDIGTKRIEIPLWLNIEGTM